MAPKKLQITLCNTCIRDNYGEGIFASTDAVEKAYREKLKGLSADLMPVFQRQNCFNLCENYHCVQVDDRHTGVLLKKISDADKIGAVCDWVKTCAQKGSLDLSESLKTHLAETVKVAS